MPMYSYIYLCIGFDDKKYYKKTLSSEPQVSMSETLNNQHKYCVRKPFAQVGA